MVDRSDLFKGRSVKLPEPGEQNDTACEINDRRKLELKKLQAEIKRLELQNNAAFPGIEKGENVISDYDAVQILRAERTRVLEALQQTDSGAGWQKCVVALEKVQRLIFKIEAELETADTGARPEIIWSSADTEEFNSLYIGPCDLDFPE